VVEQDFEESFADLFEQSMKQERRTVSPGQKVTGTVVQVGRERVILDLGDGLDGIADLGEFAGRGETPDVKPGDRVELYVVRVENRAAVLAKSLGKGAAARLALEESARSGVPVEGVVTDVNKGGYVVEVAGNRCFCPLGQMDTRRIEDPKVMIGQRLTFRVSEFRGGRDVVLSRRALLEESAAEKAAKTRESLAVGAKFEGVVTGVRDFGAFVDIGGLEGLVHASEMGFGRVRPSDVVQVGQTVQVEVLRIDPPGPKDKSERLSLSMRAFAADPWETSIADITEGDIVQGIVRRVQPFGAFVEIVPGVDGLLHVSAFGRRIAQPGDVVQVGDTVAVRIEGVDRDQRRLSLSYVSPEELASLGVSIPPAEEAPAPAATVPAWVDAEAPKAARPQVEQQPGGLKVRHKAVEAAPAAAVVEAAPAVATGAKPKVLGHTDLAPVAAKAPAAERPAPKKPELLPAPPVGSVLEVKVDKIETFGLFVTWTGGRGLLPASELEGPKGTDLRKAYPVGTTLKAAVVEVRGDGKVRLSASAAAQAEERLEAQAWMQTQKPASGKGFGTLGDLLSKFRK
jgi:small subunit ribosomal protein S1